MSLEILNHQLKDILDYMVDPMTQDIIASSNGSLWLGQAGEPRLKKIGTMDSDSIHRIINTIASLAGKELKNSHSILECEIPHYGDRFEGLLPPIVSSPAFAIRCRAKHVYSLKSYLERCAISKNQYGALLDGLKTRKNILIVGGTSTGKTTFINALLSEFSKTSERFLICEDTPELRLPNKVSERLVTTHGAGFNSLIRACLRSRPDRIIVGEIRGGEALELLKALNTGHPGGMASIHANSARAGLSKLSQYCGEVTARDSSNLISEAIDLVVYLEKSPIGPVVREILEVQGWDKKTEEFLISRIDGAATEKAFQASLN